MLHKRTYTIFSSDTDLPLKIVLAEIELLYFNAFLHGRTILTYALQKRFLA
jgi:hypothetical protein